MKSYKAAVAMCRRSVEASCKQKGAKGKNLKRKINDLAKKGAITEPLRQMAHAVRITANRGLHEKTKGVAAETPTIESSRVSDEIDETYTGDLDSFNEDDVKAMIKFTREFFHHVYVMPALLKDYQGESEPQAE